ncbi:ABC transporter ATP-binding protein [Microbacterium sp. MPKO10]|uniref:ABC transporter ATP-binding protein n=1 Tax=Microbacterium sp. MPKO10 TaxID=2989818 RepID=UPI002235E8AF|nr:ABC transporter ATP-binding protein [Microbacterium sp. MPKO10]MCW4458549.1 ABC transporter ATP-binding protein/permease [Microbacterium sp. MPKO10]
MSSPATPRRSPFARRADDGPRATFRQLLPYLFEHKGPLAAALVLGVLGAAASLAQPLLVSQVIQLVERAQPLGWLVGALVVLVIVSALISGYQHYLLQRMGEGVVLSSRRRLIARMLHLPIAQFDARRTGDLVSRVGSDTTLLRAVLTQGLVEAIGGSITFLGALIAMLIIDPVLLGLTAAVIAVSIIVVGALAGRIRVASARTQKKVGDLTAALERAIGSVRTIRASGATEREIDAVNTEAVGAWRMGVNVAKISALVVPVAGVAMQASFLVVLGVGGFRVASGAITIANLVAFILFLFMMIMPLGQAFGAISATNQALGALGRIHEIVSLESETDRDAAIAASITAPGARSTTAPAIAFENVTFSYPDAVARAHRDGDGSAYDSAPADAAADDSAPDVPTDGVVLREVSFAVERGRRTALVGPSGAGKSTILGLIERFYDATGGSIRLDGVDIRTLSRDDLRSRIGYVEQDAPVLAGSIRDNLLLASPDATDEQCIDVLHAVNLGDVLGRNPLGLDAPVGEDGIMLSGGERQRLAIARSILSAPPILLLDESTSSLDGVNEQKMRAAIDAVAEDRTLIVIAHRLSTVVDSDRIIVLDSGRVIGAGTHSELVQEVPLYRDLAKHQLLV